MLAKRYLKVTSPRGQLKKLVASDRFSDQQDLLNQISHCLGFSPIIPFSESFSELVSISHCFKPNVRFASFGNNSCFLVVCAWLGDVSHTPLQRSAINEHVVVHPGRNDYVLGDSLIYGGEEPVYAILSPEKVNSFLRTPAAGDLEKDKIVVIRGAQAKNA